MKNITALAKETDALVFEKDTGTNFAFSEKDLKHFSTLLEAEIRKEFEARITDLEDALDHIKKIAGMARVPTKRLDWIEARASMALLNEPWDKDYKPLPKNANSSRNAVRHLTEQTTKFMEALYEAKSFAGEMTSYLGKYDYINGTELVRDAYKIHSMLEAALTPQPEKEGKE